jgi:hypothetical protein
MSINHQVPRQDRRNRNSRRDVVTAHDNKRAPGHDKGNAPTISDANNGQSVGRGNPSPEGASAPGSNGPAESDATASNITATF